VATLIAAVDESLGAATVTFSGGFFLVIIVVLV
jgi:hypothetical protein